MITLLEQYKTKQDEFTEQIKAYSLPFDSLIIFQELSYRIFILKTFQAFCKTAPVTMDTNVMAIHYQMVDASIHFLRNERRFGLKMDENGKKQRDTAANTLENVIQDKRRRFASFVPVTQEQYRDSIKDMIDTVLTVWIQYRDTYVKINLQGGTDNESK